MNLTWVVQNITRMTSYAKRRQQVDLSQQDSPIKVNLGSGIIVAPGWINIDGSLNALISSWPKVTHSILYRLSGSRQFYSFAEYEQILMSNQFVHHDLKWGIPIADRSADYVFTSHFLEHLTKSSGERLMTETHRVLKEGGVVRVAVPDLAFAISLYQQGDGGGMLDRFFFADAETGEFARHKYMYDFRLLEQLLARCGFTEITHCPFREGRTPDIDVLDNRPDETLFVEATRAA